MRIDRADQAEALIEDLGFCLTLTDSRTLLPSIYIAVCGRRDVYAPKNVQKDEEMSLAWVLKDEVIMRGRVYYGKLVKGRAMFVAPRLLPYFNALYGIPKNKEKDSLSEDAKKIMKVLRKEWDMATSDLKEATGIKDRVRLTKAIEELQKVMKVIPLEVLYEPKFTYIWTLAEGRFPDHLTKKIKREEAVLEIARAYIACQGQTKRGELAGAFKLSRQEAGKANHMLVDEGFAVRLDEGVYRLADLSK